MLFLQGGEVLAPVASQDSKMPSNTSSYSCTGWFSKKKVLTLREQHVLGAALISFFFKAPARRSWKCCLWVSQSQKVLNKNWFLLPINPKGKLVQHQPFIFNNNKQMGKYSNKLLELSKLCARKSWPNSPAQPSLEHFSLLLEGQISASSDFENEF